MKKVKEGVKLSANFKFEKGFNFLETYKNAQGFKIRNSYNNQIINPFLAMLLEHVVFFVCFSFC